MNARAAPARATARPGRSRAADSAAPSGRRAWPDGATRPARRPGRAGRGTGAPRQARPAATRSWSSSGPETAGHAGPRTAGRRTRPQPPHTASRRHRPAGRSRARASPISRRSPAGPQCSNCHDAYAESSTAIATAAGHQRGSTASPPDPTATRASGRANAAPRAPVPPTRARTAVATDAIVTTTPSTEQAAIWMGSFPHAPGRPAWCAPTRQARYPAVRDRERRTATGRGRTRATRTPSSRERAGEGRRR